MDHEQIENDHVADRYLQGKLTPEEADRFEEHYFSCQECLDGLGRAETMSRGFKRAAAEDAARLAAVRQAGFFVALARLGRLGRSRQAGLAVTALFMVLLLPGLLAYREFGRLGRELDRTREALAARERIDRVPVVPSVVPPAVEDRSGAAEAERQRLEGELAQERTARTALEKDLAQARQPQANTPILSLSPERSAGGADPTHQVRLTPGWVVLSLELDAPEYESYRVTILREGGTEVWKSGGLVPNETDSLAVSLPTSLLTAGDYGVRVDGAPNGAAPAPVARFTFRAL